MRGLEEIREINENPHAARKDDALFAGRHRDHDKVREQQRFHGERVEARQRVNGQPFNDQKPVADDHYQRTGPLSRKSLQALDELFFVALLADLIASGKPKQPEHQERIHSAIDAEPPFLKFWQKLNDRLTEAGQPEAGYGQAKEAFLGGSTPVGSLTFIGKEWNGVRAVPTKAYEGRKSYRGEFREVSDNGTIWRTVHSSSGEIAYASPQAALAGALTAKNHSEGRR